MKDQVMVKMSRVIALAKWTLSLVILNRSTTSTVTKDHPFTLTIWLMKTPLKTHSTKIIINSSLSTQIVRENDQPREMSFQINRIESSTTRISIKIRYLIIFSTNLDTNKQSRIIRETSLLTFFRIVTSKNKLTILKFNSNLILRHWISKLAHQWELQDTLLAKRLITRRIMISFLHALANTILTTRYSRRGRMKEKTLKRREKVSSATQQ